MKGYKLETYPLKNSNNLKLDLTLTVIATVIIMFAGMIDNFFIRLIPLFIGITIARTYIDINKTDKDQDN